jgi:hypothetical protein
LAQTEIAVHITIFVISAKHEDLLGVLKLEGHQETDYFKTLAPAINIVSEEKIIVTTDVTVFTRTLPNVEEAH